MKTAYLVNKQDDEKIVILDSDCFETVNLFECYDKYGQTIGCYNAGCYSRDNSSVEIQEDEENHTEVKAFNYWNGSNWQSLFLNSDDISTNCIEEMDDAEGKKIIAAFNKVHVWENMGFGQLEYTGRKYKFTKTQYASDPYIATVEII